MRKKILLTAIICGIFIAILLYTLIISTIIFLDCSSELSQIELLKQNVENVDFDWKNTVVPKKYVRIDQAAEDADYEYIYNGESIDFISYSETWDEELLKELETELYNNVHGDEINYIEKIEVVDGETEEYSGYYTSEPISFIIPISYYGLFPNQAAFMIPSNLTTIRLTGADRRKTVKEMARTLSHEYGHHFTYFYFDLNKNDSDLKSDYAKLRYETDTPVKIYGEPETREYYLNNHMWDLGEIAAEDYSFFMGSELSKRKIEYKDCAQLLRIYAKSERKYKNLECLSTYDAFNVSPHENPALRPPNQVEGLADYFYSFVDEQAPEYTFITDIPHFNLEYKRSSKNKYKILWDKPFDDKNIIYTLVGYDEDNKIVEVPKSIKGDAKYSYAYIGHQTYDSGNMHYWFDDNIPDREFIRYRIIALFPDNSVYYSQPLDVEHK